MDAITRETGSEGLIIILSCNQKNAPFIFSLVFLATRKSAPSPNAHRANLGWGPSAFCI